MISIRNHRLEKPVVFNALKQDRLQKATIHSLQSCNYILAP
ncbi:hypothetical protein [Agathobacter ruminis]|nr:hypothetical protein [Agathobacter ruminis]